MSLFSVFSRDKTSVAEQPGMSLIIPVVLFCLIIGVIARTLISEERVTDILQENFKNIAGLQFKKARISLSENAIPELAVIFEEVVYDSQDVCLGLPLVRADIIKVPLKWRDKKISFSDMEAHAVNLHIRQKIENCTNGNATGANPSAPTLGPQVDKVNVASGVVIPKKPIVIQPSQLDSVFIKELVITDSSHGLPSLQFENVDLQLGDDQSVVANWVLFPQKNIQDYVSNARFEINEKDNLWNIRLTGSLREGNFSFNGTYDQDKDQFHYEGVGKYVPLNPLLGLLLQFRMAGEQYSSQNVWFNFNFSGDGTVKNPNLPLHIKQFIMEGDMGEVSFEDAQFKNIISGSFEALEMNVRNFDLWTFLKLINRARPEKNFKNLGKFNGKALVRSSKDIVISGEHTGLELIFSNKGERETQVISLFQADVHFKEDQWKINLSKIRPQEGIFDGKIDILADRNWAHVDLKSRFDELTFSSQIQRLMTSGGEVSSIEGDLHLNFAENALTQINGYVVIPQLQMNDVSLAKTKMNFQTQSDTHFLINTQIDKMSWKDNSAVAQFAKSFPDITQNSAQLIKANIQWNTDQTMMWKLLTAEFDGKNHLESTGGWDQDGVLNGQVKIGKAPKIVQYNILGHRDRPEANAKP